MGWIDSIKEAAYTSPSGKRQAFIFGAVSRETDKKTATFTFPEMDGAEVQDLGVGGRRFPLTCVFSGANCMALADGFEALLCERGAGVLEHPVYGKVKCVPTGTIKRSDDLVSELNQSVVEVTFAETISDNSFPDSDVLTEDRLEAALDAYEEAAAREFASLVSSETTQAVANVAGDSSSGNSGSSGSGNGNTSGGSGSGGGGTSGGGNSSGGSSSGSSGGNGSGGGGTSGGASGGTADGKPSDAAGGTASNLPGAVDATENKRLFGVAVALSVNPVIKQAGLLIESASMTKKSLLERFRELKKSIKKILGNIEGVANIAVKMAVLAIKMTMLPSRIAINAMKKIQGYAAVLTNIMNNVKKDPVGISATKNQFAATELAMGALVAAVTSGVALTAFEQGGSAETTAHVSSEDGDDTAESEGGSETSLFSGSADIAEAAYESSDGENSSGNEGGSNSGGSNSEDGGNGSGSGSNSESGNTGGGTSEGGNTGSGTGSQSGNTGSGTSGSGNTQENGNTGDGTSGSGETETSDDELSFSMGESSGGFGSVDGSMKTREDVFEAIDQLLKIFETYKQYVNKQAKKNFFVDASDSYEKLLEVVTLSIRLLMESSVAFPTVKTLKLGRDRQILELLCELYGKDGFNRMDEFINENRLNADEIVCIPMGREIRYYV